MRQPMWRRGVSSPWQNLVRQMLLLLAVRQENGPKVSFCTNLSQFPTKFAPQKRTKFYEFDMKPTCKKCYDRFPTELKKRISDNLREREADAMRRRSASPSSAPSGQKSKSPGVKWKLGKMKKKLTQNRHTKQKQALTAFSFCWIVPHKMKIEWTQPSQKKCLIK